MIKLKYLGIGLAIPIIIFSFAYFDLFLMPFFPSLWQLTRFISSALLSHFFSITLLAFVALVTFSDKTRNLVNKNYILFIIVFVLAFFLGAIVANPSVVENIMPWLGEFISWSNRFLAVILFLFFALGIAVLTCAIGDENIKPGYTSLYIVVIAFMFWSISKVLIINNFDFPRYDEYKILVWSEQNKDYVYSCLEPKGTLFEVSYDVDDKGNGKKKMVERRVYMSDSLESICKRLFPGTQPQ